MQRRGTGTGGAGAPLSEARSSRRYAPVVKVTGGRGARFTEGNDKKVSPRASQTIRTT